MRSGYIWILLVDCPLNKVLMKRCHQRFQDFGASDLEACFWSVAFPSNVILVTFVCSFVAFQPHRILSLPSLPHHNLPHWQPWKR